MVHSAGLQYPFLTLVSSPEGSSNLLLELLDYQSVLISPIFY